MHSFLEKLLAFAFLSIFVLAWLGTIDYFVESIRIFRRALKKYKDRKNN